jgi:hypothetical protein
MGVSGFRVRVSESKLWAIYGVHVCVSALGGFDAWESELELLRCRLAFDASSSSLRHQSLRCSEGKMRSGLAMCGLF